MTAPDKMQVARTLFEAANEGEPPEELLAPDVRIENASTAVTDAVYEGYEGVKQWRRDLIDVLEPGFRFDLDGVIDAGDDRVVLFHRLTGRGKSSQARVELRWASLCWFREGKLVRGIGFNTRREALEAVGLAGEPGLDFARALSQKDWDRIRELLAPEVDFRGMTPNRFWEAGDPETVIESVLKSWFEEDDEIEELVSLETAEVGDRRRASWRLRVRNPEGEFVVEQQAYYAVDSGQIDWMRVLCSGFRPAGGAS